MSAPRALTFLLGPCVIESREATLSIADRLAELAARRGVEVLFKASFDKANRSTLEAYRGPGLEAGLRVLEEVRRQTGLRVVTDVHSAEQAITAGQVVDVVQIPAFLCRQTDLLVAAASTGKPLHVKKGQFMAPHDMEHVASKLYAAGAKEIWLCERGTMFGYGDLVLDPRALLEMREIVEGRGGKVVYDATHSVQARPIGSVSTGGRREHVLPLLRAACAVGVDAVFAEVHALPSQALCDRDTQWPLGRVEELVDTALAIDQARRSLSPGGATR